MKKIRRQVITSKTKILIPLLLLSLTLVFTFCVSDVSAAQVGYDNATVPSDNLTVSGVQTASNSSNSTADNLSNSSNSNNQTLSDPQIWRDGVPVSRGGHPAGYQYATIAEAIADALSGDTIMLENEGFFSGDGNTQITISKNLIFDVLDGGTAIIDGGGTRWGFYISSDNTVTFNNIIFQNMYYSNGGTIRNYGTLTLNNCTLRNNGADSGGAIFNYHTLIVNNCTFTGNNATNNEGGAIYNTGTLNVNNCYFSGNKADNHSGGAIYSTTALIIIGSTFTGNTAGYGGAIYSNGNYDGNASLSVNNSTFTGNNAQYYAGAIYSNGVYGNASVSINDSTFTDNKAGTSGGAIYNNGYGGNASISVNNCTFTGNTALNSAGGAICNAGYVYGHSNVDVNNCIFAQNTAGNYGGAVYNDGVYGNAAVNVNGSTFVQNIAVTSGGAVYNNGYGGNASVSVNNCTFTGNTARDSAGGAIFNDGSGSGNATVNVTSCTFAQNTAQYYAGAIYNNGYGGNASVSVISSTFTGNSAQYYGGIIFNDGSGGGTASVVLNFNRIVDNTASAGTAVYNNGGWMDAALNWWGVNDPDFAQLTGGTVNPGSWLVLSITANPTSIRNDGSSTVTASLLYDNLGNYHDPVNGHVPDGIPVTFTGTLGSLNPLSVALLSGQVQSLFTANNAGTADINATIDSEKVSTQLTVLAAASIDVANEFRTYVDPNNPDAGSVIDTAKYLDNIWYVFSVDNTLGPDGTWVWIQNTVSGFTCGNYWMWKLDSGNWNIVNGLFSGGDVIWVPAGSVYYCAIPGQVTTTGTVTSTVEEVSQALYDWGDIYNPLYPDAPPYGSATTTFYVPVADLSISKSVDNVDHPGQTINYGNHVKYTIKVDNGGPDAAQNVIISDTISDLLNFDPAGVTSNVAFTYSWDSVNRVFTAYLINPLDAGATVYFYLTAQVLAHGQNVNNTANVTTTTYDPATPDVDSISFYVPQANVRITKTSNGPVNVGHTGTFTITLRNNGPDTAHNVEVTDVIPGGFTAGTPSQGSFNGNTWTVGDLASGSEVTLTISGLITPSMAGTTIWNTATETQDEYTSFSQTSTANITVLGAAFLSIHKEFRATLNGPAITTANYGDHVYGILRVTNNGPNNATNINIHDVYSGYDYQGGYWVSYDGSAWIYQDTTSPFNGADWAIPFLGNGQSIWLAIAGPIEKTGQNAVINTANETAQDQYYGGDWPGASVSLNVPPAAYLTVNKEFRTTYDGSAITTAHYGDLIWTVLQAWNNGPDGVWAVIKDTPNTGLNLGNSGWYYSTDGGITWNLGDGLYSIYNSSTHEWRIWIPGLSESSAWCYLAIPTQVTQTGNLTNEVEQTWQDIYAPEPFDHNTVNLSVPRQADVYVLTTANKTHPTVGENIVITIKVGNNGPDAAQGVIVSYTIPNGFEFVSATKDAGTYIYDPVTRTITWNLGNVPVGDPYMHIVLKAISSGTFDNTARVTREATYDPNTDNKASSIAIMVLEPIQKAHAASKTIPMQETGLPLAGLVLAVLVVFGGLLMPKMKS